MCVYLCSSIHLLMHSLVYVYIIRFLFIYMAICMRTGRTFANMNMHRYTAYTHISPLRIALSSRLLFSRIQDTTRGKGRQLAGKVKGEGGRCGERAMCFGFGRYELESKSHD